MMKNHDYLTMQMPALALRGLTVFPDMVIHFDVGREASIRALDEAMNGNTPIFLVSQRELSAEEPGVEELYAVGTIANIRQILRLPGDNVRVMVEGISRGRLVEMVQTEPHLKAQVADIPAPKQATVSPKAEALVRVIYEQFQTYTELATKQTGDILLHILGTDNPGYIADYIAQHIPMRVSEKQLILEELRPIQRLERLIRILRREIDILELDMDVRMKTKEQMEENQRDYYLREQIKVIREELGEGKSDDEMDEYRNRIAQGAFPDEVRAKLEKELGRLSRQPFGSSEATVLRNYLDVCLELPWSKSTKGRTDVKAAKKILDADHYGLDKVKERILEFLAVKQLAPDMKGQVLCLVGPPGVGKTSIAMSVAKAMGRNFTRVSLGGVHDEAEIRGHRKTYIGSMPGRVIEAIRHAGSNNPLVLLDEIDKMSASHQGDPASALLEVLDVEQNSTFRDHFLELPFDLSEVVFITTANTVSSIPRPLLDRMELIELSSYTDEEKVQIAKKHLLPKELHRHGLKKGQLRLSDAVMHSIISGYTKESGVRVLNRRLATLCRKAAMAVVSDEVKQVSITEKNLESYLGVRRFTADKQESLPQVGVVNGLAWTQVGGELLKVEINVMPGTGKIELTGNLGNVMKESAKAAHSYIRSRAKELNVDPDFYKSKDLHVHFPEGAVPKDGPSAGIAITTAMVSALTGTPVKTDVAMTGEVTLRGRVLPIGGLREKTMAALRSGMKTVVIPIDNQKDLAEIDQTVRAGLHFIPATQVDEVLAVALEFPDLSVQHGEDLLTSQGTTAEPTLNLRQ